MKMKDRKARNRTATAGRIAMARRRRRAHALRYFFRSIFVMVSPDWVKET